MAAYLKLLRPKQWTKNLLVFAAAIFSARLTDPAALTQAIIAFCAMCALSSATYIVNDLRDMERDRAHPTKQFRPLASGDVSPGAALVLAMILAGVAFGLGFALNTSSFAILVAYALLQVAYNLGLKHVPIADVFSIALGFIFRAVLGAAALSVSISGWLLFCTGALALMLGFAKRRHEFLSQGAERGRSRESLDGYSGEALNALVIMTAAGAALCYGIYTVDSKTAERFPAIVLTSLFVFFGIARYVLLVFGQDEGGEPEETLLRDRPILICVLLFVLSAIGAVSGLRLPLIER